jgi:hypothetical protein
MIRRHRHGGLLAVPQSPTLNGTSTNFRNRSWQEALSVTDPARRRVNDRLADQPAGVAAGRRPPRHLRRIPTCTNVIAHFCTTFSKSDS